MHVSYFKKSKNVPRARKSTKPLMLPECKSVMVENDRGHYQLSVSFLIFHHIYHGIIISSKPLSLLTGDEPSLCMVLCKTGSGSRVSKEENGTGGIRVKVLRYRSLSGRPLK